MSELTMLMVESALRGTALMGLAALLLAVFRVRDASMRSAVWSAVLAASLFMPLASWMPPPLFLPAAAPLAVMPAFVAGPMHLGALAPAPQPIDWTALAYFTVAALGLLRIFLAMCWGWRLRMKSRRVDVSAVTRVDVCESDAVSVPMTMGWLRPVVILPPSWRGWETRKLEAVLMHESGHIARGDYGMRVLAAMHRAVYWFNPLAWWLEREAAELAEQASDDHVLADFGDRAYYAGVLFDFLRGSRISSLAVPMARSGVALGGRIDRVLDERRPLSRGVSRAFRVALAFTAGLTLYCAAAVSFAQAPAAPPAPPPPPPPSTVGHPAPPAPPPPPEVATGAGRQHYRHNGESESIELSDGRLDYERNGKRYRITDPKLLAEIKRLRESESVLARGQADLAARQAALGKRQATLAAEQAHSSVRVGDWHAKLAAEMNALRASAAGKSEVSPSDLAAMQARLAAMQSRLRELQSKVENSQMTLADQQATLGAEQSALGERQSELGNHMAEASRKADSEMRKLIEQAIKDGKAKPLN